MPEDAATIAARAAAAAGGGSGGDGKKQEPNAQDAAALAAANARAAAAAAGGGDGKGGGGGGGGDGAARGPWGDTWREIVGDDKTKKGVLERYDSPKAFVDAHFALRQRLDSGELRAKLPDNPTAEQLAAYRKDNGVPEKPEAYLEGLEIVESEKPILGRWAERLHKHNLSPAVVKDLFKGRQEDLDGQIEAMVANDLKLKQATEDTLRAEWGKDYRTNIGVIHSLLASAPEELRDSILNARTPDGTPLLGTAEANRWFAQLARNLIDVGTIIPGAEGGDEGGKAIEGRMKEIQGWMGAPNGSADYNKYWKDAAVQAEYGKLLERQEAINRRRAA